MLSVEDAPQQLRAAVAALTVLPRDVRKVLRDDTMAYALPLIKAAGARFAAGDARASAVAGTASPSFYRDTPGVKWGSAKRVLGKTSGRTVARATEYGSPGTRKVTLKVRSPKGHSYAVTRHTTRMWRPQHAAGRWATPAAQDVAADVMTFWVDAVESAVLDTFGGG